MYYLFMQNVKLFLLIQFCTMNKTKSILVSINISWFPLMHTGVVCVVFLAGPTTNTLCPIWSKHITDRLGKVWLCVNHFDGDSWFQRCVVFRIIYVSGFKNEPIIRWIILVWCIIPDNHRYWHTFTPGGPGRPGFPCGPGGPWKQKQSLLRKANNIGVTEPKWDIVCPACPACLLLLSKLWHMDAIFLIPTLFYCFLGCHKMRAIRLYSPVTGWFWFIMCLGVIHGALCAKCFIKRDHPLQINPGGGTYGSREEKSFFFFPLAKGTINSSELQKGIVWKNKPTTSWGIQVEILKFNCTLKMLSMENLPQKQPKALEHV